MSAITETDLGDLRLVQVSAVMDMGDIATKLPAMFDRVAAALAAAGSQRTGPGIAHYTVQGEGTMVGAGEQVAGRTPEGLHAEVLPAVHHALALRYDAPDLDGMPAAWQELLAEVQRRGLIPTGTFREVYQQIPQDGYDRWLVDLQQPVR
ncbi:hypothetical protein F6B41_03005 [Microbacterium lushaniae]|nr:hypothetical protein F6B41_15670 [Microbacterium lushaniae]KAA9158660.1 hypothetical protein F6B41_03005 [Microbacterium lushaniae]